MVATTGFRDGTAGARKSIAVIGAGAIGCVVADAAHRCGHLVQLCVRSPVQKIEIERDGAIRPSGVEIVQNVAAVRPAEWVFIATKAQDTAGCAPWLNRLVTPHTTIVMLQNGIDGVGIVRQMVDAEVLPTIVYIAAERRAHNRIVHFFGDKLEVPAGAAGQRLAAVMNGQLHIAEQQDFTTAAWRKLICNVALNPITALTAQRFGVFSLPRIRELAAGLIAEAAAVGNAVGASFSPEDIDSIVDYCCCLSPQGGTSMLYDRLKGNRLECEHLTGTIVRLAQQQGLAVPLNKAILALLTAIDQAATTQVAAE
jgi:2-dehydropantoate 2-reductase